MAWHGSRRAYLAISLLSGLILDTNGAADTMLGLAREAIIGRPYRDIFSIEVALEQIHVERLVVLSEIPLNVAGASSRLVDLHIMPAFEVARDRMCLCRLTEVATIGSAELHRLNWALGAYARSASALIHAQGLEDLVRRVCGAIVQQDVYALSCVGLSEPLPSKRVNFVAGAGRALGFMRELGQLSWAEDVPEGMGPTGRSIRSGQPHITYDARTDPMVAPWREIALRYNVHSHVAVPLKNAHGVIGVLQVFADKPEAFGPHEMELFRQIADELAFAIAVEEDRIKLKLAEKARRTVEAQYNLTFNSVPVGIAHLAADGRVLLVNRIFYEVCGIERSAATAAGAPGQAGPLCLETVSQKVERYLDEADRGCFEHRITGAIAAREEIEESFRMVGHDGRPGRHVQIYGRPLMLEGDEVEYILMVVDVSQRMEAEQALRDTEAELARFMRATTMSELAGAIAHEISQPLGAIVTNCDAAQRWLDAAPSELVKAGEALRRIIRDATRASEIIKRIRAALKQDRTEDVALDVNAVIGEVLALTRPRQLQERVGLVTELAGGLPMIHGDRVQLQQMLVNLVNNGIEAMVGMEDRPRLLRVTSRLKEGKWVSLSVEDDGQGIDPEGFDRIFEPFFTTKGEGMGMGLAIARSVVEAHGGQIWAEAARPHGTAFRLTLPVEEARS